MPLGVVMVFNVIMTVIAFRVVVKQNQKKFFQGGNKLHKKIFFRNFVSITWLIVLFGLGWLFGLLTIREASHVFQYLFVILNAFQGFYFFIFICLNQKEARDFWMQIITHCCFKTSGHTTGHHKVYANSSDYKLQGKYLTALPAATTDEKKRVQLINYLTPPNTTQTYVSESFASTNDTSVLETTNSVACEIHEMKVADTKADSDSRIEVTVFFNENVEETTHVGLNVGASSPSGIHAPKKDAQPTSETDHTTFLFSSSTSSKNTGLVYLNPEPVNEGLSEEEEEETPVPPRRLKRKGRKTHAATDIDHSKATETDDSDTARSPDHPTQLRHNKTVSELIPRRIEGATGSDDERGKGHSATLVRQNRITRFGQHIPRQKKMVDPFETTFEVINPLCVKEE